MQGKYKGRSVSIRGEVETQEKYKGRKWKYKGRSGNIRGEVEV